MLGREGTVRCGFWRSSVRAKVRGSFFGFVLLVIYFVFFGSVGVWVVVKVIGRFGFGFRNFLFLFGMGFWVFLYWGGRARGS